MSNFRMDKSHERFTGGFKFVTPDKKISKHAAGLYFSARNES